MFLFCGICFHRNKNSKNRNGETEITINSGIRHNQTVKNKFNIQKGMEEIAWKRI